MSEATELRDNIEMPLVASKQYGRLRYVLDQKNQIVLSCSHLPFGMVQAMTVAANGWWDSVTEQPKEDGDE